MKVSLKTFMEKIDDSFLVRLRFLFLLLWLSILDYVFNLEQSVVSVFQGVFLDYFWEDGVESEISSSDFIDVFF